MVWVADLFMGMGWVYVIVTCFSCSDLLLILF